MYKNQISLIQNGEKVNCGDPFILRFNGRYYLYPSTEYPEIGIKCFVSTDLIHWDFKGIVCDDEITLDAYAPEVIYVYNRFYLTTSPSGNGHYIFTSDSPLGPFKRITGNVQNMIDGSFFLDDNNELYFSRANHKGISLVKMDENGNLYNRLDLNALMHGWTEGPFIIKRQGFYYLTYCGNHLHSKGYRVDYGTSNKVDGDYRRGKNNPLLISCHDYYNSIGHSSTVLGPDLDSYYITYHRLQEVGNDRYERVYCIDQLHFNGRLLSTSPTFKEVESPKMPDFFAYLDENSSGFHEEDNLLLSNKKTCDKYTCEFNFTNYNDLELIFGYVNESFYSISCKDNKISIYFNDYHKRLLIEKEIIMDFTKLHTLMIKASNKTEIFLDNMLIISYKKLNGGSIGYKNAEDGFLGYTAFSNFSYSIEKTYYKNLPCIVDAMQDVYDNLRYIDSIDELYYIYLKKGEISKFLVNGDASYGISIFCQSKTKAVVKIQVDDSSYLCELKPNDNPYEYSKRFLTEINVSGKSSVIFEVLEGELIYKFLEIFNMLSLENDFISPQQSSHEKYYLKNASKIIDFVEVDIHIEDVNKYSKFGLLVNINSFSDYEAQCKYPFLGYFIGFTGGLLTVDRSSYSLDRVYDVPCNIERNKTYNLKVKIIDTNILVYIDGKLIISCYDEYFIHHGLYGTYSNESCSVEFKNLNRGVIDNV